MGDTGVILEPDMSQPKPEWCVSCLAWQQLKELKDIGNRVDRLLLQRELAGEED